MPAPWIGSTAVPSFVYLFIYPFILSFFHYRHNGYGIRASTMFFMRTRNKHNKMRGVTGQFVSGSSASKTQSLNPTWLRTLIACICFMFRFPYVCTLRNTDRRWRRFKKNEKKKKKKKKNTNCLLLKIGNLWAKDGMCEPRCACHLAISFPLFSPERDK